MCSIEQSFEPPRRKLSVGLDRTPVMDTSDSTTRTDSFPRRSHMSSIAIHPGFGRDRSRTRARGPVQLTRRGQVAAALLFLGLLPPAMAVLGSHSAATGEAGTPVPTRTVQVGPGDTLWGIAADVAKPGQTREMVHQIEELNALTGPGLTVGQRIAVPVS